MPCYNPLKGWLSRERTEKGKHRVVFNPAHGYIDKPVEVPCGQCIGCRLERSRQWAVRIMHEAQMHDENCFILLTYNKENLPKDKSLHKEDFQKFMKRLRKKHHERKIRFFHCGEYGEKMERPHYHACIFGLDFHDKIKYIDNQGNTRYRSEELEKIWGKGFVGVGTLTFESAAYVARYITKKVTGVGEAEHYCEVDKNTGEILIDRVPEYVTMSRGGNVKGKGGIGSKWYEKYKNDVFPSDEVIMRGKSMKPPKFYDSILESEDEGGFLLVKQNREREASRRKDDNVPERLLVKERIAEARKQTFKRSYENV